MSRPPHNHLILTRFGDDKLSKIQDAIGVGLVNFNCRKYWIMISINWKGPAHPKIKSKKYPNLNLLNLVTLEV